LPTLHQVQEPAVARFRLDRLPLLPGDGSSSTVARNEWLARSAFKPNCNDLFHLCNRAKGTQESLQARLVEGNLIRIYRKDGTVLTGKSGFAKGSPENPMTYDEVADKFRSNAEFAKWPKQKTESVIEITKTIETLPNLSKLTAALTT
jgi:hypothetical protein